jgi:uncharacterized membrane protein YeaQ/YmgE (transglycosylase-associated protein family)
MESLVSIITQLIAGAVGGNAASAVLKQQGINMVARTIAGAIGGVGGGLLLQLIGGQEALTGLIAQGITSLIAGGVLSAIVGAVLGRNKYS